MEYTSPKPRYIGTFPDTPIIELQIISKSRRFDYKSLLANLDSFLEERLLSEVILTNSLKRISNKRKKQLQERIEGHNSWARMVRAEKLGFSILENPNRQAELYFTPDVFDWLIEMRSRRRELLSRPSINTQL